MKKSIITISVLALIALLITSMLLSVKAHSGGTDSKGGHTNHSTGEYHYHHGYSAHDHYDIDGDGKIDCPYDFENKTNSNATSEVTSTSKAGKKSPTVWEGILIGGIYVFFMFILPSIIKG